MRYRTDAIERLGYKRRVTYPPSFQAGTAAYLAGVAANIGSAARVAEAVGSTFQGIEQVLAPIIGPRGVAALYKRSLHLAKDTFSWLPDAPPGAPTAMDVTALTTALARQAAADAAAGGAELLETFYGLLTTLIGPLLTERLLRSVWVRFSCHPTARDNTA